MSKKLVAYFSASGITKKAAEKLAKEQAADLFEIRPVQPYTDADLNWNNSQSRSSVEMKDSSSRVEIAARVPDMAGYDELFLGFPIWWGVAPHIINSFLEDYDLTGKTITPFATSGGSGYGRSNEELKPSAPGAVWNPGKMIR
jgi:flavodoxin